MSDIKIPEEKVYFVYDTQEKRRTTKFYSTIGPAKSKITKMRWRRSDHSTIRSDHSTITNRYVICEMVLKLDACNQYRYDENKRSVELTELAKAIYL